MKPTLVLFFHPNWEKSRTNRRLVAEASKVEGVTFRDVYEHYPDFAIDVEAEQALLLEHEVVVFHHPLYWYSCPPLMKQYLDLVLSHGWAYGTKGTKLEGKHWQQVVTTGGPTSAYQAEGMNHHTLEEFLYPFEQTAKLCRMLWRAPFAVQGTHRMQPAELETHATLYRGLLTSLVATPQEVTHE